MQFKAADDRQADIVALERLLDRRDVPSATRRRIEDEIRKIRAGAKGEQDAAYELEFWFGNAPNWATIHDLRIEVKGLVAQVDHLVLNRMGQIWVCESKSFAEGVSVNDHGEWSRWWHGRPEGMASPVEQNRRHVALLDRAFDAGLVGAPRRLGLVPIKPEIRSLVLVSSNARIGRPKRSVDGIDTVIKADQLKTRLMAEFDRLPEWRLATAIGKEGLAMLAKSLVALHRPAVVDWAARFGLEPGPDGVPTSEPAAAVRGPRPPKDAPVVDCARCGRSVREAVVRYCEQHAAEFNGEIYCMSCQPIVRARVERPLSVPEWPVILARYQTATRLRTVARQAPFIVVASGSDLRVMPDSSGRGRTITRADFERAASILDGTTRGPIAEATRNSSYVEAILLDLRGVERR